MALESWLKTALDPKNFPRWAQACPRAFAQMQAVLLVAATKMHDGQLNLNRSQREAAPIFPVQEIAPDFNLAYQPFLMASDYPPIPLFGTVISDPEIFRYWFGPSEHETHAAHDFFDVRFSEHEVALLPPIDIAVETI